MKKYLLLLFAVVSLLISGSIKRPFTSIPLKPVIMYDMRSYAGPQGDESKPSGFFNDYGHIDPMNGVTTFTGGSDAKYGWQRHQYDLYYPQGWVNGGNDSIYWPGNRGNTVVFDMTGAKDPNDLTNVVTLTNVYGFMALFEVGDSLQFINLDAMFSAPIDQRWPYLARPDSLGTVFATLTTVVAPSGAWRSAACSFTGRYIMIRVTRKNRGNYSTFADFSELVLYGNYGYDPNGLNRRPATYAGGMPYKNKTLGQMVGTNLGNGYDTLQMTYEGRVRLYGALNYWDKNPIGTSLAASRYTFDAFPDIAYPQYRYFDRVQKYFWWSIKGSRVGLDLHTNLNTDIKTGDPEDPYNYYYDAQFYYNYAAKWGAVAVSVDSTKWIGDGGFSNGLNKIHAVENGNEDNYTNSALCYWARSNADRDGYEGRYGNKFGMKRADPSFKFIMSGTTDFDVEWTNKLAWFSRIMRTDKKFLFDFINFHHYPRTSVNALDYAPSSEQQVGVSGASPESDAGVGLYRYYTDRSRQIYNILDGDTSVKILNTEYGYSNWGHPATTANQAAFPWALDNVPSRGIYDSLQYKAILLSKSEILMLFTPIYGYNDYFFHNTDGSNLNSFMLFLSYGRVALRNISPPFNATYFTPAWYYIAGIRSTLRDYRADDIVQMGDTSGIWVLKLRNVNHPDSICIAYWKATQTGATLSNQVIPTAYFGGSQARKTNASFTSVTPTTGMVDIAGRLLFQSSVTEEPVLLLGTETHNYNFQPWAPPRRWYKTKA